jgi:undecaprenyl phosphate N,N'-diacetylbacillosamine 1-phosphate transferase
MYRKVIKRIIDIIVALILLVIASPILLLCSILLWIGNNGTPYFTQLRPGKNDRIFKLIKFKTMNDKKDLYGNLLEDHERITKLGNLVRKSSIDELPQLINVLKGDMSLIGPRPLLIQYLELYNSEQKRRHNVKPGITGWAQVNGRNAIDWEKKFELDVWYVEHMSFLLDFKIVIITIVHIFASREISNPNHVTMPFFEGNKK